MNLTYEERMLMAICNTGSREGLIDKLVDMRSYLEPEEEEAFAAEPAGLLYDGEYMNDDRGMEWTCISFADEDEEDEEDGDE